MDVSAASISVLILVLVQYTVCQSPERCGNGLCVTPRQCRRGYFYQKRWMTEPFSFCCHEMVHGYRAAYSSPTESLQMLDCRFRKVSYFERTEIDPEMRILDLSFNKLSGKAQFIKDTFLQNLPELKSLTISQSNLGSLPSDFLYENEHLEHLVLNFNTALQKLPEDLLTNCPALVKVDFSGNEISVLPKKLFKMASGEPTRIQEIRITNNRLKFLAADTFRDLPALEHLDLSHNRGFECISEDIFQLVPSLSYIGLKDMGDVMHDALQKEFCSYCEHKMHRLKWFLKLYRRWGWWSTRDLCGGDTERS